LIGYVDVNGDNEHSNRKGMQPQRAADTMTVLQGTAKRMKHSDTA